MTCLRCQGHEACLSYSANVHAAETVDELLGCFEAARSTGFARGLWRGQSGGKPAPGHAAGR